MNVKLNLPLFPTTVVGSFPKPDYLVEARSKYSKKEMDENELKKLELKASDFWVDFQTKAGVNIISDGEMDRGDMVAFFSERMDGFKQGGLVRSYGNRYYRKPIITGPVKFKEPMTVEMWKRAKARSGKYVKGILTGPYTMMDWLFNEYYPSRKDACIALAEALRSEVQALYDGGCRLIQIDEPAISTRPEEIDFAIEANRILTEGLEAKFFMHICYGDWAKIYPKMLELPVDQFDLEFANRNYELLNFFKKHPFTKEVGYGVVDVHSHNIETEEQIIAGIKRGFVVYKPEQMYIDPDCGLKTRSLEEAQKKMEAIVEAVKELRKEY